MNLPRAGAMTSQEVVTGNIEFYTLFTSIDITHTGDYADNTQKDFESLVDQGADSFTNSTGKAVNLGQVLRGVSDTSDAIALSLGDNPKYL